MLVITWIIRRRSPSRVNRVFRRAQIVSGSFVAFTHGTNDAQKTMGIISLALIVSGHLSADFDRPPLWVIVSAALAMALGTYAGGWRIIKTMGTRIAKIDPPQGFAAQTACAGILWTTAHYGFPVSTTQTITGCVMGAGASRRFSAVRWGVAGNIAIAWILTLPAAAFVGAVMELVTRLPAGDLVVFILAGAIAAAAFIGRRYETRRLLPRARPSSAPHPTEGAGRYTMSRMATRIHTESVETLLNRELSHLEFHARVLEVATDETLPLLERVKFCAIFSSNLDEFFQVRVAGLLGQVESGLLVRSADGLTPHQALARIRERVLELSAVQSRLWKKDLRPALEAEGIVVGGIEDLSVEGARQAREALPSRDLPRAHAARRRAGPTVPVHLGPVPLARDLRGGSRPRRGPLRAREDPRGPAALLQHRRAAASGSRSSRSSPTSCRPSSPVSRSSSAPCSA